MERGLARRGTTVPRYLGLDEKSSGQGPRFATVAFDIEAEAVIDLAEDRTKESVYRCLGAYSLADLAQVEAVAIDVCPTYVRAIHTCVQGAQDKVVFDRFHVVQHMTDSVEARPNSSRPKETINLLARATHGSMFAKTFLTSTGSRSIVWALRTSTPPGPGPSRRNCATCRTSLRPNRGRHGGKAGSSGYLTAS